ncbi:hypothetical protein [Cellulomonas dongxiuzhuiae]|uniref:Uncharacterized protein n=1 Tax=Cellulomonas dongxiuzhuiae TaxID=2819979 RepID=A0ABX8GI85_9CELL|nr:hypothetical protein [Cellulomonas dongxiuzhuiae]MBO3094878.1 hypothetical protein [Cellulomonas dongxiuzhuiae]QWC15908.1 hypothetical protein KKR89_16900 [Cellulomonas dongxiuzhuiae]
MTRVRAAARAAWAVVWRPLAGGAGVGVVVWALGMRAASAVVVALAAATLVAVLQRVDGAAEPRPTRRRHEARDGARGEVLDLAWTMVGRDGRAGERALRRLREAGARRVARHGLDLDAPEQADAVTALIGARARATLTRRTHPLPTVRDLVHTLDVLERLGATRSRPATSRPDPEPDPEPHPRSPR